MAKAKPGTVYVKHAPAKPEVLLAAAARPDRG
jgi:hypothetical protein